MSSKISWSWLEVARAVPTARATSRDWEDVVLDANVSCTSCHWSVVSELEIRVLACVERAGRESVMRAVAVGAEGQSKLSGPCAGDHKLLVDTERGVVLRSASRLDGEKFGGTPVLAVAFDADILVAEPSPNAPGSTEETYDERKRD